MDLQNWTQVLSLGGKSPFLQSYLISPQSLLEFSHFHLLTLFDTSGGLIAIANLDFRSPKQQNLNVPMGSLPEWVS